MWVYGVLRLFGDTGVQVTEFPSLYSERGTSERLVVLRRMPQVGKTTKRTCFVFKYNSKSRLFIIIIIISRNVRSRRSSYRTRLFWMGGVVILWGFLMQLQEWNGEGGGWGFSSIFVGGGVIVIARVGIFIQKTLHFSMQKGLSLSWHLYNKMIILGNGTWICWHWPLSYLCSEWRKMRSWVPWIAV